MVQPLKRHAEAYIKSHQIKIEQAGRTIALPATQAAITSYIEDASNPLGHREMLLKKWNLKQKRKSLRIALPNDLVVTPVSPKAITTLSGYDSDDEKAMRVEDLFHEDETVELQRQKGEPFSAYRLNFRDSIRLGRHYAKKGAIKQSARPWVTELGPLHIEFAHPGTEDIYAFPLKTKKRKRNPEDEGEETTVPLFQRTGGTGDFSYKMLVQHLERDFPDRKKQRKAVQDVLDFVTGDTTSSFTSSQAELAAAIACDGMKGVSGMLHYVEKARTHLKSEDFTLANMFTIDKPGYRPAASEGRSKATRRTRKLKQASKSATTTTTTSDPGFPFTPPDSTL